MDDLKNNKMFWVLAVITIFNIGAFLVGKVVVDRAAERVIERLEKDYSPSPYGPGFDPDKVSPEAFRSNRQYFMLRNQGDSTHIFEEEIRRDEVLQVSLAEKVREADAWREQWEQERGFSPAR